MNGNKIQHIEHLLDGEDYVGALGEIALWDGPLDADLVAVTVRVFRAAGKKDEARSFAHRNRGILMGDVACLLRCLPALLADGYGPEVECMFDEIEREVSPHEAVFDGLLELAPMTGDDRRYLGRLLDLGRAWRLDERCCGLEDRLAGERPAPRLASSDDVVRAYVRLFSGLVGVHAVQVPREDRWIYVPVRRSLDVEDWRSHLEGRRTLGVYPLKRDGTIHFAALDVDVRKSHLPSFESDIYRSGILEALKAVTLRHVEAFEKVGLTVQVENSGKKGFHVWLFFDEAIEARLVRRVIRRICDGVRGHEAVSIEVFPKQDQIKDDQIGNLIKIPSGLHQASGWFSHWVDSRTLQAIPDQTAHVLAMRPCHRHDLLKVADHLVLTRPEPGMDEFFIDSEGKAIDPSFVGPPPADVSIVNEPCNAIKRMLQSCPVLGSLHRRALDTHVLTGPERHVLTYVFGVLGDEGRLFVHQCLHRCIDYDHAAVNKALDGVPPNPMSCPKLRKWLPDTSRLVGCRCHFDLPPEAYPSPLVHAGIFPKCSSKVQKKRPPSRGKGRPARDERPRRDEPRTGGKMPATDERPTFRGTDDLDEAMRQFFEMLEVAKRNQKQINRARNLLDGMFKFRDGEIEGSAGLRYKRVTKDDGRIFYQVVGRNPYLPAHGR